MKKKLLDRIRDEIRVRHYSIRTEEAEARARFTNLLVGRQRCIILIPLETTKGVTSPPVINMIFCKQGHKYGILLVMVK